MSNYLEKYLKYKSKYQQLKIQKGGAKLGDHIYMTHSGRYFGVIVGYNSSLKQYVVLQKNNKEGYLEENLEDVVWTVDDYLVQPKPSKTEIQEFIDKNRSRGDVEWLNLETSVSGSVAVSSRGATAVSSKLTQIDPTQQSTEAPKKQLFCHMCGKKVNIGTMCEMEGILHERP
jgi:hypothetical protein